MVYARMIDLDISRVHFEENVKSNSDYKYLALDDLALNFIKPIYS